MKSKGYTALGWITWRIGTRVARRKLADSSRRLGALAAVALVVLAGIALAGREG